jgi:hypothetical protein
MKKRFFIGILLITSFISSSFGQAVPFLNAFSDTRTAAMGNAGYALPSPFGAHRNTAAIIADNAPTTAVAISYLLWQPQNANTSLLNAGGYTQFKNWGLAAGFRSNSLPTIEKTDEQGNVTGTFSPSEYVAEVGLGCKINSLLSAGAAFRYLSSDMGGEKKGIAMAADISMLYSNGNISAGIGISNIGSKITYDLTEYVLPARLNAGGAYRYSIDDKHALTGIADAAYQLSSGYTGLAVGIGAEYTYNHLLSMRTGYHLENSAMGASYATLGCGVHLSAFEFGFACIIAGNNHVMRQTMMFSLKWEK